MRAASEKDGHALGRSPLGRAAIVAACLLAGAIAVSGATSRETVVAHRPLGRLPMQIGPWQEQPVPALARDVVAALGVDDFVNRVYSAPRQPPVALYVGYYESQHEGDTMHSPLNCLPGAGWQPLVRRQLPIVVAEHERARTKTTIVVNRLVIAKGLDRELVLYWYQSHGRVVANEYWGRVLLAYDAFRLHRTDGALVRIVAPIETGDADGERVVERAATSFVQALVPVLSESVPE